MCVYIYIYMHIFITYTRTYTCICIHYIHTFIGTRRGVGGRGVGYYTLLSRS